VKDRLKVALIADPYIPIPPFGYGGIERIIDFLINHLLEEGHEVILVAHHDSTAPVPIIPFLDQGSKLKHIYNTITISKLRKFKPDIIHNFGRLAYLLPFLRSSTPKIMSYQREPTLAQIKKAVSLSKKNTLSFTGCSNYISDQIKPIADAVTIYNGFPINTYNPNFEVKEDAPLVFLGRLEHIKGVHVAIEVALKSNKQLIIAGNIPDGELKYFKDHIEHQLSEKIQYVGSVNDQQKNDLLRNASALLMPILWNEPFGIVMVEAMACGTPVIGLKRGSVPEVIQENVTGFICNTAEEMVNQVDKIKSLSRAQVYQTALQQFNSKQIVDEYINLYRKKLHKPTC
jgi:glycosyltransferase involved in cell wall biosynthesis